MVLTLVQQIVGGGAYAQAKECCSGGNKERENGELGDSSNREKDLDKVYPISGDASNDTSRQNNSMAMTMAMDSHRVL